VLVGVPPDIEAMRLSDPGLASAWRAALRDVLGGLLADGARVLGFDRADGYVVDRRETSHDRREQP
jgi:predicted GNAT superfamily acetyltransferase